MEKKLKRNELCIETCQRNTSPYKFDPGRFIVHHKKINYFGVYLLIGLEPRICIDNKFVLLETTM
ncbi:cytochrome P450 9e2-like [Vespula maculifrons]|uniref:Cytochrome P450 9e2-like n=1 Tax=Vespula maculifrons TaxID=7453 RepID=A0ABD2B617_VESMC